MSVQLDPEARGLLEIMQAAGAPPIHTLSVEEARQRMRTAFMTRGVPLELADVRDVVIPLPRGGLTVRVYRPTEGELPLVLFLHGGGWTINDLDTHDELCRRLARRSGCLIAAVDYRRAPEYRHPAALEDAYMAYRWLLDNAGELGIDASVRMVMGESAGATSVAALTLLSRDLGAPMPTYQLIAYPVMDAPGRWPSYAQRGSGYTLDREQIEWFESHYLPHGHDYSDPYLFPLHAADLSALAPALVVTAEFDPLRDEGVAYARKLEAAGVPVEHMHAEDQMHGFLLLGKAVSRAGELIDRLAGALASHARQARAS
jgi:acetyl esterase